MRRLTPALAALGMNEFATGKAPDSLFDVEAVWVAAPFLRAFCAMLFEPEGFSLVFAISNLPSSGATRPLVGAMVKPRKVDV